MALHAVILNTHYVILNEVKNLLNDNTLCALSLVGFEGMLALLSMTYRANKIATSLTALAMTETNKITNC